MSLPLTKQWLIDRYLFGVDLTDEAGAPYPDSHFVHSLTAAQEWARGALDLELEETTVTERHDFNETMWSAWSFLTLRRRPLISVTSLALRYGSAVLMNAPAEWLTVVSPDAGQVQLIPISQAQWAGVSGYGIVPWLGPGLGAGNATVPGFFEVTYKAGFVGWTVAPRTAAYVPPVADAAFGGLIVAALTLPAPVGGTTLTILGTADDGSVTETLTIAAGSAGPVAAQKSWTTVTSITPAGLPPGGAFALRATKCPSDILHLLGSYAAVLPLNTAGDLIAGAGVASKSVSMDGLSTSINTTASAENTGYGARVKQHLDDVKRLLPVIRRRYHGISMGVA